MDVAIYEVHLKSLSSSQVRVYAHGLKYLSL